MQGNKEKKYWHILNEKISTYEFISIKWVTLKLFSRTISDWHFFGKLDRLAIFFRCEFRNLSTFWKQVDHVFVTFTISLFDSGVCLPFNKGNELNLKRNHKSNLEKVNLSLNKPQDFSWKKSSRLIFESSQLTLNKKQT